MWRGNFLLLSPKANRKRRGGGNPQVSKRAWAVLEPGMKSNSYLSSWWSVNLTEWVAELTMWILAGPGLTSIAPYGKKCCVLVGMLSGVCLQMCPNSACRLMAPPKIPGGLLFYTQNFHVILCFQLASFICGIWVAKDEKKVGVNDCRVKLAKVLTWKFPAKTVMIYGASLKSCMNPIYMNSWPTNFSCQLVTSRELFMVLVGLSLPISCDKVDTILGFYFLLWEFMHVAKMAENFFGKW